jgi:hypothetical protein
VPDSLAPVLARRGPSGPSWVAQTSSCLPPTAMSTHRRFLESLRDELRHPQCTLIRVWEVVDAEWRRTSTPTRSRSPTGSRSAALVPQQPDYPPGRLIIITSGASDVPVQEGHHLISCEHIRTESTRVLAPHCGTHPGFLTAAVAPNTRFHLLLREIRIALDRQEACNFAFRCRSGRHRSVTAAHLVSILLTHLGYRTAVTHHSLEGENHFDTCLSCHDPISDEAWTQMIKRWDGLNRR